MGANVTEMSHLRFTITRSAMATNAVTDPGSTSVWKDERYDPLAWRWHGPALGIAMAMALATAIVALSDGLSVKDTDKMLSARSAGLIGAVAFFIVLDLLPRAIMRRGRIDRALVAVARERWNRRRFAAIGLGLLSFYVTYLAYRNLKGFLPFITDQDYDPKLMSLDRTFFLGHDPGPFLHSLLGTGISAQMLSTVYLFFLAFVPISLGAALIASANPIPGLWYVTALGINWTLGIASYLILPSLGPIFAAPDLYSTLPDTGTSALQQALIYERHEALAGRWCAEHRRVRVAARLRRLTAALIATLLKVNRVLRYALWVYLGLTMVATLYFGWHYVADDLAGIAIGLIAVPVAGIATGHLKPAVPERWRAVIPNALTAGRIAVVPLVVWLLIWDGGLSMTAALLFATASVSDAYDGFLARRWNVTSSFGALLDPFADKLLVLGSLGALAAVGSRAVVDRRRGRRPRGVGDAAARPGAPRRRGRGRRPAGQAEDVRAGGHAARR